MQRCWEVIDAQVCGKLDRMHMVHVHSNNSRGTSGDSDGTDARTELRVGTDSEPAAALAPMAIMN